jgi:hypothetical protein
MVGANLSTSFLCLAVSETIDHEMRAWAAAIVLKLLRQAEAPFVLRHFFHACRLFSVDPIQ